jgi:DNA sulfur modification protein DndD
MGRKKLVGRLGDMATEIFRELDNDPDLYGEIRFDSVYRPYLQRGGEKWEPVNLSQGHQTIFAYSILGALMRLSGFSLPAVIDTPMMKLDRVHKNNVVGKLYPRLSHQVILFSSEEEIDETYYPRLLPYINTSYVIKQNSIDTSRGKSKSSYVEKGYFDFAELLERPRE